jgi:hypothetical protein
MQKGRRGTGDGARQGRLNRVLAMAIAMVERDPLQVRDRCNESSSSVHQILFADPLACHCADLEMGTVDARSGDDTGVVSQSPAA